MTPQTRDRLVGFTHAFDQPVVRWLTIVAAGILVTAPLVMLLLGACGLFGRAMRQELMRRYLSWAVIAPLVVGPVLLGAAWMIGLVTALSLLCYAEFARATGVFREKTMSALIAVGILLVGLAALDNWYHLFVALPPMALVVMAIAALLADRPHGYIQRVGLASLSFLLFGACFGHLSYMANDPHYRGMVMLLLICVAMNDVFAFCVGKTIGGAKLCPNTSPNKTVAGAVGALLLTTGLFVLLGRAVFAGTALGHAGHLVAMGLMVSFTGQCGDLTISSVKRDVGIKDMGSILPGHGGVLDRCNSLLLAAPAMFHYINYFLGVGLTEPARIFSGG